MIFAIAVFFSTSAQQSRDGAHRRCGVLIADPFLLKETTLKHHGQTVTIKKGVHLEISNASKTCFSFAKLLRHRLLRWFVAKIRKF